MLRKVFKTGNSIVVSLPKEALATLNISEGTDVNISIDHVNKQVIIKPMINSLKAHGITEEFSKQVDEFIERYRPALDELAK